MRDEDKDGIVYAIGCVTTDAIKIGFTKYDSPRDRLAVFQAATPFQLSVLGFVRGTLDQEQELIRLLTPHRIRGEWFRREGLVEEFLSRLTPQSNTAAQT